MTHTTNHTPGPWVAALGEHLNTDVYRLDEQGNRVFVAEFATQADALLGAAAPAVYDALQHAATSYHHPSCKAQGEYAAQPERYCTCHVQKARTALAQAERRE